MGNWLLRSLVGVLVLADAGLSDSGRVKEEEVVNWILDRNTYTSESVVGDLYFDKNGNGRVDKGDERLAYTLELPWKNNERNISCIPMGRYTVSERVSARFGQHYLLNKVSNRSYILIHAGNYPKDTVGCILVGDSKKKDFVGNSRKTLKRLREKFKGKDIELQIRGNSQK